MSTATPGAIALISRVAVQPRDLLDIGDRQRRPRPAAGEVDALHRLDHLLERREAAAQQPAVDEHHREQRDDEHEEALALDDGLGVQAGDDRGGEHGGRHEQRVDGQNLRQEGRMLHRSGNRRGRARAATGGAGVDAQAWLYFLK
jgi:hypothetical protein